MFERICLVHYHEIGLKGHNRFIFENRLIENMRAALVSYKLRSIKRISGHILLRMQDDSHIDEIADILVQIPGIVRVSTGWRTERDSVQYNQAAELALYDCGEFNTFKVSARRNNTDYPINSMELNQLVGAHLCKFAPDKQVKMKNPDVTVHIHVVQGSVYVYSQTRQAIGGLPVGSAGKVACLMSSGIDSPVAAWKMMKRGAVIIGVHFSGRPETEDTSEYLVDDIAKKLAIPAGIARIYYIPLGMYQRKIAIKCPQKLRIVLYRRLMLRIAEQIAFKEGAKALVTGESLGQVASQTLDNIAAINSVVDLPVLRPLIGTDKQEIITCAQDIGTFDISNKPAADCCTLYMPRNPETHAKIDECTQAEKDFSYNEWIEEIMDRLEYKDYPCPVSIRR